MRKQSVDTVVAAVLLVTGLLEGALQLEGDVQPLVVLGSVPFAAGAVAVRRSRPAVAIGVFVGACLVQASLGSDLPGGLVEGVVLVLLAFTAGSRPLRSAGVLLGSLFAGMALVIVLAGEFRAGNFVYLATVIVAAGAAGYAVRVTRERGELLAEQRVLMERARIAGELHDVVTHGVSAIVVQAAAERRVGEPEGERADVLADIEERGRETLTQLRALLGVLHADGEVPLAPQPGLAELPDLVAATARSGVEVTLRAEGQPRRLDEASGLTVYRVVQEALTNIRKHSASRQAAIVMQWLPDVVAVEVTDPGPRRGVPLLPRSGHGLRTMAARVQALGGSIESGDHGSGFRVRAVVPERR